MRIFIPTRARIYKQITRREFFLDHVPYSVRYIVPEAEYKKAKAVFGDVEIIAVPDDWKLSDIRQWLIDDPDLSLDPYHIFMDDDLVFLRRKAPLDVHQRKGNKQDAIEAFQRMEHWLQTGYAHGSLSQRGGNNHCPEAFKEIGRATDCHFYNAAILRGEEIKINQVMLRQDFHTTLSLLELGYPNLIDHEFMSGQQDGTPGGCQVYRTPEMLAEQAHLLASLHPGLVKVIEKTRKGGFGTSTDVRISWQKAFRSRINERKLP